MGADLLRIVEAELSNFNYRDFSEAAPLAQSSQAGAAFGGPEGGVLEPLDS